MFYVSSVENNKYGVVDTDDGIEESYTRDELFTIVKSGIAIKGVDLSKGTISCYLDKFIESQVGRLKLVGKLPSNIVKLHQGRKGTRRIFFNGKVTTKTLSIPFGITHIDDRCLAYSKCEEVVIPDSVYEVGNAVFICSNQLKSVKMSSMITFLGEQCFKDCTALKSIRICPSASNKLRGRLKLKREVFADCSSLEWVDISKSNCLSTLPYACFYGCSSLKEIKLPDGLKSIEYGAFYGCSSLEHIEIPSTVKVIQSECFCNCRGLKSIVIPPEVKTLGIDCFCGCSSLESVVLSSNLTSIEVGCFGDCISLKELDMSELKMSEFDLNVVYGCTSLVSLKLPKTPDVMNMPLAGLSTLTALKDIWCPEKYRNPTVIENFKSHLPNTKVHFYKK